MLRTLKVSRATL